MLEAIKSAIEAKFQVLANDGRAFVDKVDDVLGLANSTAEFQTLENHLMAILTDGSASAEQKVEAILHAIGKL
ncbi:hypothetical protein [Burkholderia diffusa]|uniref:hypothetical protein n=1 Tax=Burkholderia diffusa TaxID=488732 RepID=UPI002ABD7526|nr:hypothetical protein [Burkholderia diffusa]